ncbi:MAG: hypothetical protein M1814_003344 [Vezdaea aestivalis]|nr:MAG: hypothetical protein M1814_003344 [Vezdaea aestivalis]
MRPLIFSLLLPLANALTLKLHLAPLPVSNALPFTPSTHLSLTSPSKTHTAPLLTSQLFTIRNLTAGSYSGAIHSNSHLFPNYRLDVDEARIELTQAYLGQAWDAKGPVVGVWEGEVSAEEVVEFSFPVGTGRQREFYEKRVGFSPLDLLKNPMILIALFSLAMVFGTPYLLDNSTSPFLFPADSEGANDLQVDEETRAEFEKAQKSSPLNAAVGGLGGTGPAAASKNSLANFDMAAWMAGKTSNSGGVEASGRDGGEGRKRR